VCPECSYGCNINIDSREYEVKRFASRDNPLVEDMWLCDRGRDSVPRWNRTDRVRRPVVRSGGREQEVSAQQAVRDAGRLLREVRDQHGANAIGVIGSSECTNEEAWLLQRLAREAIGTSHLDHQLETFPGLSPDEHALGIADIEGCSAVVVLGPRPEQQAPVLTLRLFKAQRKRGTAVHRLPVDVDDATLRAIPGGWLGGVGPDEADRAQAAHAAQLLAAGNTEVRRLTVTRGVNGRGCKDLGLLPNLLPGYRPAPGAGRSGTEILEATSAGQIRALLIVGSHPWAASAGVVLTSALNAADQVVAIETQPGPVSQSATVLIPGHTHVEKAGSVTNLEGRVQRIRQALPPATTVPTELRELAMLAAELGCERWPAEMVAVNRDLAATLPAYAEAGNGGRARWSVPVG
jgi:NADH-quinone oxidoreductase subunit G